MLFTTIAELLGDSTSRLNILLSKAASGDELTVVVIPTVEGDDKLKGAIARPLSLTGSAEELDAEFATLLGQYGAQRKTLAEQINAELTIMAADTKASAKRATDKLQAQKGKAKSAVAATTAATSTDSDELDEDEGQQGGDGEAVESPSGGAQSSGQAPAGEPKAEGNPLEGLSLFA